MSPTEREWEAIYQHGCDMIAERDSEIAQLRADLTAVVEAAGNALDRLFMYDPNTSVIDELDRALDRPSVLALREAK